MAESGLLCNRSVNLIQKFLTLLDPGLVASSVDLVAVEGGVLFGVVEV